MSKFIQILIFVGIAVLAISAGFYFRTQLQEGVQNEMASEAKKLSAESLFSASLPDVQGQNQAISQWQGKVIVVNFWATWCTPCQEEIPEFIESQKKFHDQGLVYLGIALDQANKVKTFSEEFGINYPVLVGGLNAWSLAEATGNRMSVLPYTVVINRSGMIVETYVGRVNLKKLEKLVIPLLKEQPQTQPST